MENTRKISDELFSGGQVTPELLEQAVAAGFKSVLNVRSPEEKGFVLDEQQQVEATGLKYANVALPHFEADEVLMAQALQEIQGLPKPIFVHCGSGGRASSVALIALATQEGLSREQVLQKVQELGLNPEQPHLKHFLTS